MISVATDIIDAFQELLTRWAAGHGLEVDWPTWWEGRRNVNSRNILTLKGGASEQLIYVKVRSKGPGFWGITKNRLNLLRAAEREWCVVLLLESPQTGYLLPSNEVERCVGQNLWRRSPDGDFKIHEAQLSRQSYFQSFQEFAGRLGVEAESKSQPIPEDSAFSRRRRSTTRDTKRSFSGHYWVVLAVVVALLLFAAILVGGMSVCTPSSNNTSLPVPTRSAP